MDNTTNNKQSPPQEYICRYCSKTFGSQNALNSHHGKAHVTDDTSDEPFKPTDAMIKALEASFDMNTKPTITGLMGKAGLEDGIWYKWIAQKKFVQWWSDEWDKFMRSSSFHLDKIGYLRSAKDFRYWEAMQIKYAKYKKSPEVEVTNYNFTNLDKLADTLQDIYKSADEQSTDKEGSDKEGSTESVSKEGKPVQDN